MAEEGFLVPSVPSLPRAPREGQAFLLQVWLLPVDSHGLAGAGAAWTRRRGRGTTGPSCSKLPRAPLPSAGTSLLSPILSAPGQRPPAPPRIEGGAEKDTLPPGRRAPPAAGERRTPGPGNRAPQPPPTPPGASQMLADGRTESAKTSLQKRKAELKTKIQTLQPLRGRERRRGAPGLGLPVPSAV